MQQAVRDGAGCRHVAQQVAPLFHSTIGGHHRRTVLVPVHDDLQEDLAALGRQYLQYHVVDGQQIRLEVALEQARLDCLGLGLEQVAHKVKYRAVKHREAGLHRLPTHRLPLNPLRSNSPNNVYLLSGGVCTRPLASTFKIPCFASRCVM